MISLAIQYSDPPQAAPAMPAYSSLLACARDVGSRTFIGRGGVPQSAAPGIAINCMRETAIDLWRCRFNPAVCKPGEKQKQEWVYQQTMRAALPYIHPWLGHPDPLLMPSDPNP